MSDFKTAYDNFMTLSDHMMDCVDQEIAFLEKKDYKSLAQMLDYKEESYKSFNDIVEILQIFFSKGDYDKDLVKEIKAMVQKLHDRLQENHDKIQKAMQVNEKMMSVFQGVAKEQSKKNVYGQQKGSSSAYGSSIGLDRGL